MHKVILHAPARTAPFGPPRGTSANGVLLNWANDGFATTYVISQSTDNGGTYNPIAFAGATDTGVLLTNITNDAYTYFKVDGYSASGDYDTASSPLQIAAGSGTPGVYTLSANDSSFNLDFASTSSLSGDPLSVVNSVVAANSAEEALLLSLGGQQHVDATGADFTPLSGAFKFYDDYVTHGGSHEGPALGLADTWHPGDNPGSYDFNSAYMRFNVTKLSTSFGVSVATANAVADASESESLTFIIRRFGDVSQAADVYYTLGGTAVKDTDYNFSALSYDSASGYNYVHFDATLTNLTITIASYLSTNIGDQTVTIALHNPPSGTTYEIDAATAPATGPAGLPPATASAGVLVIPATGPSSALDSRILTSDIADMAETKTTTTQNNAIADIVTHALDNPLPFQVNTTAIGQLSVLLPGLTPTQQDNVNKAIEQIEHFGLSGDFQIWSLPPVLAGVNVNISIPIPNASTLHDHYFVVVKSLNSGQLAPALVTPIAITGADLTAGTVSVPFKSSANGFTPVEVLIYDIDSAGLVEDFKAVIDIH